VAGAGVTRAGLIFGRDRVDVGAVRITGDALRTPVTACPLP
jgi:hypothetical protein